MLVPWVVLLPRDWAAFCWPDGSWVWRMAVFGWWGLLALSGVTMFLPGVLDRLKFTQGLVAHSHLAMAGFTTSVCALLLVALTGRPLGGLRSVAVWHVALLCMLILLVAMGWREGGGFSWMATAPAWRAVGLDLRAACGVGMLVVSAMWLKNWKMS